MADGTLSLNWTIGGEGLGQAYYEAGILIYMSLEHWELGLLCTNYLEHTSYIFHQSRVDRWILDNTQPVEHCKYLFSNSDNLANWECNITGNALGLGMQQRVDKGKQCIED